MAPGAAPLALGLSHCGGSIETKPLKLATVTFASIDGHDFINSSRLYKYITFSSGVVRRR
jgi:hypothetical protein